MIHIAPCLESGVVQGGVRAVTAVDGAAARVHRLWSAGRDERIAAGYREEAEAFVLRRSLGPGVRVLDAACGSGSATIPAARTGAEVTGVDLVALALDSARARAVREGLRVTLDHASVEELPYPDASFDVVLSLFGVMFAARPDRVLAELARVTRPGGRVVLASWAPGGVIGELHAQLAGPLPVTFDLPDPIRWGNAELVREWLEGQWEVEAEVRRTITLRYPHTAGGTAELFRSAYPPAVRAFGLLAEDTRAALAAELTALWTRHRRSGSPGTEVEAEYLEVEAVRLSP